MRLRQLPGLPFAVVVCAVGYPLLWLRNGWRGRARIAGGGRAAVAAVLFGMAAVLAIPSGALLLAASLVDPKRYWD